MQDLLFVGLIMPPAMGAAIEPLILMSSFTLKK